MEESTFKLIIDFLTKIQNSLGVRVYALRAGLGAWQEPRTAREQRAINFYSGNAIKINQAPPRLEQDAPQFIKYGNISQ